MEKVKRIWYFKNVNYIFFKHDQYNYAEAALVDRIGGDVVLHPLHYSCVQLIFLTVHRQYLRPRVSFHVMAYVC